MRKITVLTAAALLLGSAASAHAAFPGKNGDIVFRSNRTGNADIYTMHADGSGRVDLTRNPAEDVDPRWSPDGTRIVFASNRTGSFQIYTMAADGSDVRQVTVLAGDSHRPTWTADGRILFQSDSADPGNGRDVYAVNADGSGLTDLTPAPSDDLNAAAAPHGDRLAFSSNRDGGYHLYVASGGSAPREITSGDGFDFQPNWSPSGNDLVFLHVDPSFSDGDLYVVHANGTGLRRLTATPNRFETEPVWSPDGTKIAFHGCSPQDGCVDYEINADGTGETVVTKTFTAPFADDFSSTPLDDFWSAQLVGAGTSVQQANGRLELSLAADATADPASGFANPGVFSVCNLRGDFDIQVDYDLLTQPFPDFVNPLFNEGNFVNGQWQSADGIFLSKWGISGNFDGIPFAGFVPNVPPQGSMRLVRQGSNLTASFSTDGTTWQTLETRNDLVADESDVALSLFSNNLPGTDVKVAFDNFRVDSGTFSCPTWWDDEAPDWGSH
jgi:Tol biopolymer transport system component